MSTTTTSLVVGVVQPPLRRDDEDPLEHTRYVINLMMNKQQKEKSSPHSKIDIFVLPELSPIGYSENTFSQYLNQDDVHQKIHQLMCQAARDLEAHVCYGCIGAFFDSEKGCSNNVEGKESGEPRRNTIQQRIVDRNGDLVGCYDKIHLCNYGDCAETRFFTPGPNTPCVFPIEGKNFRLGVLICADMRNPTLTRRLAAMGADGILHPACFSRDVSFRTYKSFRETRAVENSVYWVGVNYAGALFGNTSLTPPWVDEDHEPTVLGFEEGVLVGVLDKDILDHVRSTMPFFSQQLMEEPWEEWENCWATTKATDESDHVDGNKKRRKQG